MIFRTTDKIWADHRGNEVPREYVPAFDRHNEQVVARILRDAERISTQLAKFKEQAFAQADKLYKLMLKEANVSESDRKGNFTLTSFDKSVKIEVNVSDRIDFDDNITLAQMKLNEFIKSKTDGTDRELATLVNHAFTTRKGRLDKARVFGLLQLNIKNSVWNEAMELIRKSITTNSSVRYMEIAVKDDAGKYVPVKLNFANI